MKRWAKWIVGAPFAVVLGTFLGLSAGSWLNRCLADQTMGIPLTLQYDVWQGRTAVGGPMVTLSAPLGSGVPFFTFGSSTRPRIGQFTDNVSINYDVGSGGSHLFYVNGAANSFIQAAAAQFGTTAVGGYVVYVGGNTLGPFINFANTTLGQFGMAGTSTTVALMAGNGSGVAQTPFNCTTGVCTVGPSGQGATFVVGGGSAISALPGVITLPSLTGQGAGTGDFARGSFPNETGTATIETCTFRNENAGTNAVNCQPILYDVTASANVCAVTTFNCNSASGTTNTCTGGTIPANHVFGFRWTIAATGVSPIGSLVCSYHF